MPTRPQLSAPITTSAIAAQVMPESVVLSAMDVPPPAGGASRVPSTWRYRPRAFDVGPTKRRRLAMTEPIALRTPCVRTSRDLRFASPAELVDRCSNVGRMPSGAGAMCRAARIRSTPSRKTTSWSSDESRSGSNAPRSSVLVPSARFRLEAEARAGPPRGASARSDRRALRLSRPAPAPRRPKRRTGLRQRAPRPHASRLVTSRPRASGAVQKPRAAVRTAFWMARRCEMGSADGRLLVIRELPSLRQEGLMPNTREGVVVAGTVNTL